VNYRLTKDLLERSFNEKAFLEMEERILKIERERMMKNWQGQEGLSADCKLGVLAVGVAMTGEHPCDRCNVDRKECRGFPPKTSAKGLTNERA